MTAAFHGGRPRLPIALYTPLQTIHRAGPAGMLKSKLPAFNWSFKKMTLQQRSEHLSDLVLLQLVDVVVRENREVLISLCKEYPI